MQAPRSIDEDIVIVKAQFLKQQSKNKHLVTKGVEAKRIIKKAKTLLFEYNELIQAHFKTANDLDLQTNFDWLTKDYGKMEAKKRPCWSWRVPIYSRGNN